MSVEGTGVRPLDESEKTLLLGLVDIDGEFNDGDENPGWPVVTIRDGMLIVKFDSSETDQKYTGRWELVYKDGAMSKKIKT